MKTQSDNLFTDALNYLSKFKTVKEMINDVKFLINAAKEHPVKYGAIAASALIYLISPFDTIPDAIPVVGFLDDAAVIAAAVASIKRIMS